MRPILFLAAALALAACSDNGGNRARQETQAPSAAPSPAALPKPAVTPAPLSVPAPPAGPALVAEAPKDPRAVAVNEAAWSAGGRPKNDPALLRAQVLLARAHFSPGVIDGQDGGNFRNALSAFERAHGLAADGKLDEASWAALTAGDAGPAVVSYTITDADVRGPFRPVPANDYKAMSALPALGYATPLEALAEKFHADEALLTALNPYVDFAKAGGAILVPAVGVQALGAPVTRVEVDKTARQVRAFGADGQLLAAYPATVGSAERPAPTGDYAVKGVAMDPVYTYDPKRLTFGDPTTGKVTIRPGPNNPVGVAWIAIDYPTYGIHGAPDPKLVGKTASHGCVRLTNWDARELAQAVKPGATVSFQGSDGQAKKR
jgi:lipoprotein-anchoring transpeptidase ErfK/SrfK